MQNVTTAAKLRMLFMAVVLPFIGISLWYYGRNTSRLESAIGNLRGCQELAADIIQARQAPQKARLETWSQDDLGTVVEKAAADAQLPPDRVLRIDPQPPKRLGRTDYLEQATEVELMNTTLRQLVDFLYNVTRNDDQLEVATLRLRMPHDGADATKPELWLADVVLAQRIYAPANPPK
jgi:hypothetical protein